MTSSKHQKSSCKLSYKLWININTVIRPRSLWIQGPIKLIHKNLIKMHTYGHIKGQTSHNRTRALNGRWNSYHFLLTKKILFIKSLSVQDYQSRFLFSYLISFVNINIITRAYTCMHIVSSVFCLFCFCPIR